MKILRTVPTTAVGKIFKPALLELEIESVVRARADELGVTLDRLTVVQDKRRGYVARIGTSRPARALAAELGRYTFAVEWEDEATLRV